MQVLQLLNAPQGSVAPGHAAGLNFVFSPVEAKEYTVSLPVQLGNGTKETLTVTGKGFHPLAAAVQSVLADSSVAPASSSAGTAGEGSNAMLRTLWQSQVADDADKATWPGFSAASSRQAQQQQPLTLSHGVVSFGPVSIKRHSKRVVALVVGPHHAVEFEWDLGMLSANGCLDGQLEIQPANGRLAPGECCLCKLTFTAGLNPQLFEGALHCKAVALPHSQAAAQAPAASTSAAEGSSSVQGLHRDDVQSQVSPGIVSKAAMQQTSSTVHSKPCTTGNDRRSPQLPSSPGVASGVGANSPRQQGKAALAKQGGLGSPSKGRTPISPMSPAPSQRRTSVSSQSRTPTSRSPADKSPQQQKAAAPALHQSSPSKGSSRSSLGGTSPKKGVKAKQSPARISSITNLPARSASQSPMKPKQEPGNTSF